MDFILWTELTYYVMFKNKQAFHSTVKLCLFWYAYKNMNDMGFGFRDRER